MISKYFTVMCFIKFTGIEFIFNFMLYEGGSYFRYLVIRVTASNLCFMHSRVGLVVVEGFFSEAHN